MALSMYSMPSFNENMAFDAFFSLISGDRAFLPADEHDRFVPTCCAMANGEGGWVVLGASLKEDGLPVVEGVPDVASLEKQLTLFLKDGCASGANPVSYFRVVSNAGKKILTARVEPAEWRLRPVCVGNSAYVYRRIDGENVISSQSVRWRMALDALEVSRDDATVPGMTFLDLDSKSIASFRAVLSARFPKWKDLSMENFLKRALVLDERGAVTRAGELLLGKNSNLVRFSSRGKQEVHEAANLWTACTVLLPQISGNLTAACTEALRECLVNAMLHAEHDAGVIDVELGDGVAIFSNPGLPRPSAHNENETRNYRLMRIFVMAGLARGVGRGLDIIRGYDANFRLRCDMLELITVSELPLSTETKLREQEKESFQSPGWLPVVQERLVMLPDEPPIVGVDEANEISEAVASEEEDEYLGASDNDGDVFSPLVRQVRDTPRMQPAVVRDAILELCSEYKSLPELASTIARSENSLRRHYVTSMVKEGLLEMEYPDKVGHPDQRYRTAL